MIQESFAGATTATITSPTLDGYYPCNPSIAQGPDGYGMIVTYRNLWRNDDNTHVFDASGIIATRNFFITLNTSDIDAIMDHGEPRLAYRAIPHNGPVYFSAVRGVEDPRLFWQDGWKFAGSIREHHASGEPRLAWGDVDTGVSDIVPADSGIWVKNLMPTGGGRQCIDVMTSDDSLHGGAVTACGDGYLGIVHEIEWPQRAYSHRFAMFSKDGRMTSRSHRFKFGTTLMEFAAGIVVHGDHVVVSYGAQDRDARLASVPICVVLGSL